MMFLKAVSAGRRVYPVITNGLKLYVDAYNLDSYGGSGTTWTDLSNSAYNLTISGATWTTSGGRRYFELDGVNDYIWGNSDSTIFDLTSSGYTWSMWVYHVTSPQGLDVLVMPTFDFANLPYSWDHRNNTGSSPTGAGWAAVLLDSPAFDKRTVYAATVATGVWKHACYSFTYTSATACTLKIYLDGSQVTTQNHTITSGNWTDANTTTSRPVFGAFYFESSASFARFNNIRIGEILYYNRTLSGTEISDNYNSTKSNYGL